MSILTRAGDLVYTFRFLKLLVTPFEKTKAFELGIIDAKGKRINKPDTPSEKSAYTPFHRLVYNIKQLIPGGSIGSYASALYLIKEKLELSDKSIEKICQELQIDILAENNQWFMLEDQRLSPGIYRVKDKKMVNSTHELIVNKFDKVRISEDSLPVGSINGLNIYSAIHIPTRQQVYVTAGELLR